MCVPIGFTVTYGVLASLTGTSPRAIGRFMAMNKDLVIVPCHRVVSSRGLGGFTLGTEFKRRLLELEGALNGRELRVIRTVDEFWSLLEELGSEPLYVDV